MSKKPFKKPYDGHKKYSTRLTPADAITERFIQAYDPIYRNSIYQQMRYAFGETWRKDFGASGALDVGGFPDYPDIKVRYQEIGRSRRILNSQFIGLSRVMYSDPQPEFPQVDKYTAEVRKQFFLARYRGTGAGEGPMDGDEEGGSYAGDEGEGEWADEMAAAFMDGDGLGLGFVQVCLRTNRRTGFQQVHLRHSPLIFTLWDRFERSPGRARWIAFVRYMPVEEAALLFGREQAEANVRLVYDGQRSYGVRQVRYFEYYDTGYENGAPTRAVILGDIQNPPAVLEENAFGCLPMAYYCHLLVPGMRTPIGRIAMQMNTQESINEVERALKRAMRAPQFSIADVSQLDEEDMKRVNAGEGNVIVRWKMKPQHNQPPFIRTPGAEVAQTVLKYFEVLDEQFTVDSGVTDFDRGVQPRSNRTLGEDQLIDQRGQTQTSWSELQAMRFHIRTVRRVLDIAGMYDRDPATLDIFGKNYTVNDPARPASTISHWLKEPSQVAINADSLRYQDVQQVRAQRLQQLLAVAPFVGSVLDSQWFGEELAKALGEQDPKTAMATPSGAAPSPGVPGGMPGSNVPQ